MEKLGGFANTHTTHKTNRWVSQIYLFIFLGEHPIRLYIFWYGSGNHCSRRFIMIPNSIEEETCRYIYIFFFLTPTALLWTKVLFIDWFFFQTLKFQHQRNSASHLRTLPQYLSTGRSVLGSKLLKTHFLHTVAFVPTVPNSLYHRLSLSYCTVQCLVLYTFKMILHTPQSVFSCMAP